MPSRLSGGDKEQKPAKILEKNAGSAGPSLAGSPSDRVKSIANRHAHPHRLKVAEKGKSRLNLKTACVVTDRATAAQEPSLQAERLLRYNHRNDREADI
jgi:hypothetical protein